MVYETKCEKCGVKLLSLFHEEELCSTCKRLEEKKMNEKTQELVNKVENLFKEYYKEEIEADILRDEINKTLDNIEDWVLDSE